MSIAFELPGPDADRCAVFEDFLQSSSGTLPNGWGTRDTSAAGSPTLDYVDDADNGEYVLTLASTDEAETIGLTYGDSLHIDVDKNPVMQARVKFTGTISADDRFVCGLASADNATLDSVATHAWIKADGSTALLWETDDGTTDDNDNQAGVSYTAGTYFTVRVELNGDDVFFYVDGELVGKGDVSDASGNLQPYIVLQKDAGTVTHSVTVDYVYLSWDR